MANIIGVTGPTGATGPVGPTGPTGNNINILGEGVGVNMENSCDVTTPYTRTTSQVLSGMVWTYSQNNGQNCRLLADQQADNYGDGFEFGTNMQSATNSGMQIVCGRSGGWYNAADPGGAGVMQNTWLCYVFVANGTDLLLYRNGVEVASTAMAADVLTSGNTVRIGNGFGGGSWSGLIAHVALWDGTALTPADVQGLYTQSQFATVSDYISFVESLSPTLYYPMQETSGSTATNSGSTGAADNGTYQGSYALNQSGGPVSGVPTLLTVPQAPTTVALTSGTAWQNTTGVDVWLRVPVTYAPTGTAAATLASGVGPTSTPTQTVEVSEPAGGPTGVIHTLPLYVPQGQYALLTATNATLGTATVLSV